MIEVRIVFRAKDHKNDTLKAAMMIGQDGSVALSRYGRPNKLYLQKSMEGYERYRGWDLIFEALKQALNYGDEVDDNAGRKKETGKKVETQGKQTGTKNKKVPREPGV